MKGTAKCDINIMQKRHKTQFSPEIAVVLYFWIYQIIQPFMFLFNINGKILVLLALFSGIIMLLLLYRVSYSFKHIFVLLFFVAVLLIDGIFRFNSMTLEYLQYFIMYALLPFLLMAGVKDYKKFLRYFCASCVIAFIYFIFIYVFKLTRFYGYMDLGFGLLLPSYIGLLVYRLVFKRKRFMLFEFACLLATILFANRSCLLAFAAFWLIYGLAISKKKRLYRKLFVLALIILFVLLMFAEQIVLFLDEAIFERYSITYRPWYYIKQIFIYHDWNRFTSNRIDIWTEAWQMFLRNPILGYGTGYFDTVSAIQNYPHNIVLELLLQLGGILAIVVMAAFIYRSGKVYREYKRQRDYVALILFVALFSMWFPKLLLSNTYFRDMAFWMFLSFILLKPTQRISG